MPSYCASARFEISTAPMCHLVHQLRVPVIADNAEARCAFLAALRCKAVMALDGAQGVAAAAQFDPHLVFSDLEIPGMGGCDVARQMRAHRTKSNAIFICLTGRCQPGDRRMCKETGFDDFFTNPMFPGRVATIVNASVAAL